ncbi:uncharacterized protein V6R79_016052 [Siganus canaliculatus]
MPPKTKKAALVKMLENLSSKNFDDFRHELLDRREEPQVRQNKVENKGPRDIADVMVSTFTETGAVSVADEILREQLDLEEQANRLAADVAALTSTSGTTSRPSAVAAGAVACGDDEHFVDKHEAELKRRVTNVPAILDDLLQSKVIQQEQYEKLLDLHPTQEQMRRLFIIVKATSAQKDIFYNILKTNEKWLVEELQKKN